MAETLEKPKAQLEDPKLIPETFVTEVVGMGFVENVITVDFATQRAFVPSGEKEPVIKRTVTARLAMTNSCAANLFKELGRMAAKLEEKRKQVSQNDNKD